ncbi:unnamed protein product [Musa hybrid cultivar]
MESPASELLAGVMSIWKMGCSGWRSRARASIAHIPARKMKSCACLHVLIFSTMHNQSYNYENELVCRIGKLEVTVGRFTIATMISCSNPSLCRM